MCLYQYKFEKIFYFIWKCQFKHIIFRHVVGTGFGLTKMQSIYSALK